MQRKRRDVQEVVNMQGKDLLKITGTRWEFTQAQKQYFGLNLAASRKGDAFGYGVTEVGVLSLPIFYGWGE